MITVTDASCRNCNHIHWMTINALADPISVEGCAAPACKCSKNEFAPDDNLEYLEWIDSKKNANTK